YEGTLIGSFVGGANGVNLVITFNANANAAAVQALIENITYENTDSDNATTGARTVRFVLTDGDGGTSANYDTTVTVSAANHAPTFNITGDGKLTTAVGSGDDIGAGFTLQSDGKMLVIGKSWNGSDDDFALTRYNTDGSLDTTFGGGDGILTTAIGSGDDRAKDVTVQSDGKILVTGLSHNGTDWDFALTRYNSDGTLDTSFGGGDGILTTAIGAGDDLAASVTMQSDGKIQVSGSSDNGSDKDLALVRYNTDGSLDTSFDGDGILTTAFGSANDFGNSVAVQSDGKILVAGTSFDGSDWDFSLARYNTDGSLDTSFDGDGKLTTGFAGDDASSLDLSVQGDGKILLAGYINIGGNYDFALARYNTDGSLDTSFDGDGVLTTAVGSGADFGHSLAVQSDGKILVAGRSHNGSDDDFALVRYDTDGSLDTTFGGGDGMVTTAIGAGDDNGGQGLSVQSDGKIVVVGRSHNGTDYDFGLIRYNTDGSLDTTFDTVNTLDGAPTFTEGGAAVVLDADVDISDAELDARNSGNGDYHDASVTLVRNGGVSTEDVFSFSDGNGITLVGGTVLQKAGATIASFNITTTPGQLVITFTNANGQTPTSADVDYILQQITYANSSDDPSATAQINWSFDDGDASVPLQATGSTTVTITPVNDIPVITNLGGDALAYTEGDGAQIIDQATNAAVTDVDSSDFNTG
ncbi:MAG: hypothetical protein GY701_13515, partial [Sulfitobacter sp.]|nr:hypothetical protein [Sulfitobacter sp.]